MLSSRTNEMLGALAPVAEVLLRMGVHAQDVRLEGASALLEDAATELAHDLLRNRKLSERASLEADRLRWTDDGREQWRAWDAAQRSEQFSRNRLVRRPPGAEEQGPPSAAAQARANKATDHRELSRNSFVRTQ